MKSSQIKNDAFRLTRRALLQQHPTEYEKKLCTENKTKQKSLFSSFIFVLYFWHPLSSTPTRNSEIVMNGVVIPAFWAAPLCVEFISIDLSR